MSTSTSQHEASVKLRAGQAGAIAELDRFDKLHRRSGKPNGRYHSVVKKIQAETARVGTAADLAPWLRLIDRRASRRDIKRSIVAWRKGVLRATGRNSGAKAAEAAAGVGASVKDAISAVASDPTAAAATTAALEAAGVPPSVTGAVLAFAASGDTDAAVQAAASGLEAEAEADPEEGADSVVDAVEDFLDANPAATAIGATVAGLVLWRITR